MAGLTRSTLKRGTSLSQPQRMKLWKDMYASSTGGSTPTTPEPPVISVGANGELLPAFYNNAPWLTTSKHRWWAKPAVAPLEPNVTPGVAQITIAGTNSAPNYDEHLDVVWDGRTKTYPAAATQGSPVTTNCFEFGEGPAPRTYQPSGARRFFVRNMNGGGRKQQFSAASESIFVEGLFIDQTGQMDGDGIYLAGSTPVTATCSISGDIATISGVPTTGTIRERHTIVGAASGTRIRKQLTGTAGKDGTYRVNISQEMASKSCKFGFRPKGYAQGNIVINLKGTDRDHYRIAGVNSSGENSVVPDSITQTGNSQVTVVLPSDFPGNTKAFSKFTASIAQELVGDVTKTVATVTEVTEGTIAIGQEIRTSGVTNGTYIESQVSGTTGGVGKYVVDTVQTVTSRAMTAVAYEFKLGGTAIGGVPSVLNNGFEGTYQFVSGTMNSPSAGKITLVLTFSSDHITKPGLNISASAGTIWAISSIPGEHADPLQVDKDKLFGGLYVHNNTFGSNYQALGIARNSAIDVFDIFYSRVDAETPINLTNIQDSGSFSGWFTTTAEQIGAITEFKDVYVELRPNQNVTTRFTPGVGGQYSGGIATTAIVDGGTRTALGFDAEAREGFRGIVTQGRAPANIRYGYVGQASAHNGVNYVSPGYSGGGLPTTAHLQSVVFEDNKGITQTQAFSAVNDYAADALLGYFDVIENLPPPSGTEFHILDMTSFNTSGISSRCFKRFGAKLSRGPAMLPAAGFYPAAITATFALRDFPGVSITKSFDLNISAGSFAAFSGAFTKTFEGHKEATISPTDIATATFTATAPAVSDRVMVAVINSHSSTTRTLDAVTIGGVAATRIAVASNNVTSNFSNTYIYQALVPAGTDATVVADFSGTVSDVGVGLYSVVGGLRSAATGLLMVVDFATGTAGANSNPAAVTLGTANGGCIIGGELHSSAPTSGQKMSSVASVATVGGDKTISTATNGTLINYSGITQDGSAISMASSGSPTTTMAFVAFAPHV